MNTRQKFEIVIPPQTIQEHPRCLEKIANGDQQAFAWLYKNYCKALFDYSFILSANRELAEDIVHDVFVKLWEARERLLSVRNFNSYLFTMAKNHFLNICNKQKREQLGREELKAMIPLHTEDIIIKREEVKILETAVRSLTPRQELIFRLIKEEGITRNEISHALGISPLTVKVTMQNAIKGVKTKIKQRTEE